MIRSLKGKNIPIYVLLACFFSLIYAKKFPTKNLIVSLGSPESSCLQKLSTPIKFDKKGIEEANIIANNLLKTIEPLMPAAGFAAPQIGINKRIFIYSWDRSKEHMEIAINPTYAPVGESIIFGWESCFSCTTETPTSLAHLARYETIDVKYYNLQGEEVKLRLTGFAAKVFQHEYDHLQGVLCVTKEKSKIRSFKNAEEIKEFMKTIKTKDAIRYIAPEKL